MYNIKKIILISVIAATFYGCGIYSFTGASIPVQAKTFSVDHFPNNAPLVNPTLSQNFTDALKDKFTRQTNLQLINGIGDLHFEGSITGYSSQPQTIGGDDRPTQSRLTVSVRVKYLNEYEPDNDFEQTFSRFFDYASNRSLSEVESQAIDEIVEALVEDIFNRAVVNW